MEDAERIGMFEEIPEITEGFVNEVIFEAFEAVAVTLIPELPDATTGFEVDVLMLVSIDGELDGDNVCSKEGSLPTGLKLTPFDLDEDALSAG